MRNRTTDATTYVGEVVIRLGRLGPEVGLQLSCPFPPNESVQGGRKGGSDSQIFSIFKLFYRELQKEVRHHNILVANLAQLHRLPVASEPKPEFLFSSFTVPLEKRKGQQCLGRARGFTLIEGPLPDPTLNTSSGFGTSRIEICVSECKFIRS
jgi:hypothetical protein